MPRHDELRPKVVISKPRGPRALEIGFTCSFSQGTFRVRSPSGKSGLLFDDSDQFGPSVCHPRTGDLSPINDRLAWFWDWYPKWRAAGRPTVGGPMSSPIGDIFAAMLPVSSPEGPR